MLLDIHLTASILLLSVIFMLCTSVHCLSVKCLGVQQELYQVGNRCGGTLLCNFAKVESCESQLALMVPQTVLGLIFGVVFNVAALLWGEV